MIDIDHFKTLNDSYGHLVGDEVLTHISLCIIRCTEKDDLVVRYGGEEFLVLLTNKDLTTATRLAQKINIEVAKESESTVSIGVASSAQHRDFDNLVHAADQAMYAAKSAGRNCVRIDSIPPLSEVGA